MFSMDWRYIKYIPNSGGSWSPISHSVCALSILIVTCVLQVKVAFGEVWKESLSELSGGQRSLVALSLILSLLLFKPAPLYILDEVDAALDLSHTQNIGHMLKTHFKHSQVRRQVKTKNMAQVSFICHFQFILPVTVHRRVIKGRHVQ